MKNFIKMIMCLCTGIIAVNAMEPIDKQHEVSAGNPNVITFDGNQCVKDCDYI